MRKYVEETFNIIKLLGIAILIALGLIAIVLLYAGIIILFNANIR
jgi:hypothetical protein